MTPLPTARTAHGRRTPSARWFTAPLVALALLGSGAGTSSAAVPADDADHQSYVQSENEPAFTDPSAREDELPPYDAGEAQQAVDDMVMDEEADEEADGSDDKGRHCPPSHDDGKDGSERQGRYERWGPHRDEAYPSEGGEGSGGGGGGDGQDVPAPPGYDDPNPEIVG
ncbi:hypothetical protein [Streptomyces sp. NBC_00083]|uniref:hypothetical protein n=1 Tax=Streptomyces sp. NBC_00083 TaxID=2975647 RepID=UPI0022503FE0|nr:hypothetical protein [Streptomyces sp. NBC_00083]MCX5381868.1 hypothetical protein [Streptomyces sp. NBC_00083]